MSGYSFFLSYARDNSNPHLTQFVDDLTARVRGRLGLAASDPVVYRDTREIEIGETWPEDLLKGLQTSRSLLAIYTPRYFQRPVCGQEIGFFQKRLKVINTPDPPPFLLPVMWIPCEDCIPKSLGELSFLHEDLPASYRQKGLETLTRQSGGRYKDDYEQVVDALVERVAKAAKFSPALPELTGPLDLDLVPNAFLPAGAPVGTVPSPSTEMLGRGPNAVGFLYVAGTKQQLQAKKNRLFYGDSKPAEWSPFVSKKQMIGALAPLVAGTNNFIASTLSLEGDVAEYVNSVEKDNSILVLIVDTWTLHLLPKYEHWMSSFDRINSLHTSVIVVWNEEDLDTQQYESILRGQIAQTFATQSTREEMFFRPTIRTCAEFESALTDTLIRLQDKIIQYKQIKQVLAASPFVRKPELTNVT